MIRTRTTRVWMILGLVGLSASHAGADTVTYTLENVTLADGEQITGAFDWTYSVDDFEGGSGVFTTLEIPYTPYSFADGNLVIGIQTNSIEISGNGDFHDMGLDITLHLSQPFTPTESGSMDLTLSFFECCGNGFHDQAFLSGSISPYCIADVTNVLADTGERFFWPAVPAATMYYAYLGVSPSSYDHVCIGESETPEWSYNDEPLPGEAFYFLFSAAGDCGEGGLGAGRPVPGCTP